MTGVKLNEQELHLVTACVKALFKTVDPASGEARHYADVYARLTEQTELDEISKPFVLNLVTKVLERLGKVKDDPISSTEARLRAEVVEEIYVGIKEKINGKQ
jgi:hypothetical protein